MAAPNESDINRSGNKQNEEERRQIREKYRKFQEELSDQVQEVVKPDVENDLLYEKLSKVEKLFKSVNNPREAALDSASLVNISELGKKKAQKLKTDFLRFNAADFCEKVRIKLASTVNHVEMPHGLSHDNWVSLGRGVQPFFNTAPVLNFMYGSFERGEVESKKKKVVKEKEKESESAKATRPTQLSSFEETDRGELTTAQVEHLLKTLWGIYEKCDKSPVCFFEFVVNPYSFGQTVENIFYVSFLVRDGHVKVSLDEEDLPVIEPIQKNLEEMQNQPDKLKKRQVVVTLTPAEWKKIVDIFKIEQPVIEPMKPADTVLKESNHQSDSESSNGPGHKGKGKGKGKKSQV